VFLMRRRIVMGLLNLRFKMDVDIRLRILLRSLHPGTAPSNLAIMGRYILTPEIFMF
jgi:UTP-glucose-1-phosphate uridylyltransferase